jgi:hypothetical protein
VIQRSTPSPRFIIDKMHHDGATGDHVASDGCRYPGIPTCRAGHGSGGTVLPKYSVLARKLCLTPGGFLIVPDGPGAIPAEEAAAILRCVGDTRTLADWLRARGAAVLIFVFFSSSTGANVSSPCIVPLAIAPVQPPPCEPVDVRPCSSVTGGRRARSPSPQRRDFSWSNPAIITSRARSPPPAPPAEGQACMTLLDARPVDPWDMPPLQYGEYRANSIPAKASPFDYMLAFAEDRMFGEYLVGMYIVSGRNWSMIQANPAWPRKHPRPARYGGSPATAPFPITGGDPEPGPHACGAVRCSLCRAVPGTAIIRCEGVLYNPGGLRLNADMESVALAYARHMWNVLIATDLRELAAVQRLLVGDLANADLLEGDHLEDLLEAEARTPSGRPLVYYDSSINGLVSANAQLCELGCPIVTVYVGPAIVLTGHQNPGVRLQDWVAVPRSR